VASSHDLLVFIPAWNEEQNLPAVLAEVATELPEPMTSSSTRGPATAPVRWRATVAPRC
jgi:hypothetical protein